MKIAIVSPLIERVPPKTYGGTERVVSYLTEALVEGGADVTLFASGDSLTSAKLVGVGAKCTRGDSTVGDPTLRHFLLIEEVLKRKDEFDVIHFHTDPMHFSAVAREKLASVFTFHGRLDIPELINYCRFFPERPVTSISLSQRRPMPWLNWVGNIYHGLPRDLYRLGTGDGGYLAFLGRICADKGIEQAIQIAEAAQIPLKIAAKVDKADNEYHERVVRPLLERSRYAEFIGEINEFQKQKFLGEAIGLLFPIDWPEPFGMVMIESMACGTPVIAFDRGSVPEVIDHGITGWIVRRPEMALEAISALATVKRSEVRRVFEHRFTADRMAAEYFGIYETLVASRWRSFYQSDLQRAVFAEDADAHIVPMAMQREIGRGPSDSQTA